MLRFMMPSVHRTYTVAYINIPDFCVKHRYICCQTTPARIILHEQTHIMNHDTSCLYLFRIKGNDLILDCCVEESPDEINFLNDGYCYIRVPEKENVPVCWDYIPFEDMKVYCAAKITRQKINGIEYEVLTVKRTFLNSGSSHTSTECYVAGFGLQNQRVLTNDPDSIYLPGIFNYSLN